MQPQRIKSMSRVPVKNAPSIELTPELEEFCRKHNYWPGRLELRIRKPTEHDRELAQELRSKIDHLRIIYET